MLIYYLTIIAMLVEVLVIEYVELITHEIHPFGTRIIFYGRKHSIYNDKERYPIEREGPESTPHRWTKNQQVCAQITGNI